MRQLLFEPLFSATMVNSSFVLLIFLFSLSSGSITFAATLPFPTQLKPTDNDRTCAVGRDVQFEWSPVSSATSYTVQVWECLQNCHDPNSWNDLRSKSPVTVNGATKTAMRFTRGGEYWWRVWANQGTSQGRKSDWFHVFCT